MLIQQRWESFSENYNQFRLIYKFEPYTGKRIVYTYAYEPFVLHFQLPEERKKY